jgi:integrase
VRLRALKGPDLDGRYLWRAEWQTDGDRRVKGIGWKTERQALVDADDLRKIALNGEAYRTEIVTIRDLLENWFFQYGQAKHIAEITKRNRRANCSRLATEIGHVRLDAVDLSVLIEYRDRMLGGGKPDGTGYASNTVALDKKIFAEAWEWGRAHGVCPDRKLPKLKVGKLGRRDKYTPTRPEVVATVAAFPQERRHLTLFHVLAGTGARIGEATGLRWGAVDLPRSRITFDGKTGKRMVPISDELCHRLAELHSSSGPVTPAVRVFGVTPKGMENQFRKLLGRAAKAADVPAFTPHGLRRFAVDEMCRAGVDVGTAAAITGHSVQIMLAYYRQANLADMEAAVAAARLGSFGSGNYTVLEFPGADHLRSANGEKGS